MSESQKLDLQIRGLYTSPNNLSGVPQGALEIADNIVINSKNVADSRRGQTQYGSPLSVGSGQVNKIFNYASSLISSYDDKLAYDSGSGVWVPYSGTYLDPADNYKMRSLEALKNFYFTTSNGVYKIDALTSTPRKAGVVKALGGTSSLTGSSGFLADNTAVAYRLVWGYRDANNNLLLGSPSQRLVVINESGGSKDVALTFTIPASITPEYFYQFYRSNGTLTAGDEPSDELQLVLEGNPTAAEITAKTFTVTDSTPYSLMRTTLYTSPSLEGIANANDEPPFALDMDIFKGSAFYANITQKQRLFLSLISVDIPSLGYLIGNGDTHSGTNVIDNLQSPATLVVQDLTYTADAQGFGGNDISITYTGGGTAGAEVVSVVGSAISVQIQSGVSTATEVETAINGSAPASALISVSVSGTAGDPQVTAAQAFLAGGFDTSLLRVGMRVVGTGVPTNTVIRTISTADAIVVSANSTASATVSLQFQDRFTIALVDYWAGSAQNPATNTFLVDVSGTPGQNINNTAINLTQVINSSPSNTLIYAYYTSALDDLPGQMLFEERSIGGDEFFATSTSGSSFSPPLPEKQLITSNSMANPTVITTPVAHGLSSGDIIQFFGSNSTPTIDGERTVTVISPTTFSVPVNVTVAGTAGYFVVNDDFVVSDNDARPNRVAISKAGQVEAVPLYTFFDIGSANFPIQRVVALRDGIFFFKTDGIYRLSGESFSNYTVSLLDNTATLKVPESAVPFNNQVFCFTDQGICAVADSGVQIISVPIEDTLLELSSEQFTNFMSASFGVAYESARLYMFFTVTEEDDTFATQAFVYNSLTDSWSRWVMNRTCGVVNSTVNKLFMAKAESGQILIERKSFTNDDFADEQYAVTITVVTSDTEVTLASATNVEVGMTIAQGARRAVILEIDGTDLTLTPINGLTAAAAIVYTPIEDILRWVPIDCENPGILKQFSEISLQFKNAAFREIDASFSTNISTGAETVPILNNSGTGWGDLPWGEFPWGGQLGGQNVLRTYVPREKQRGHWLVLELRTNEAFTGFSLQGVSTIFNPMSSRFK